MLIVNKMFPIQLNYVLVTNYKTNKIKNYQK